MGIFPFQPEKGLQPQCAPPLRGEESRQRRVRPYPIPRSPALFCEDTSYPWISDYRCNTPLPDLPKDLCAIQRWPTWTQPAQALVHLKGLPAGTLTRLNRTTWEPRGVPGETQGVPRESRESPRGPRGVPGDPGSPRGAPGTPGEYREGPRGVPRESRGVQGSPRGVPRESRESPRGPHRESRETPGRPREHPEGLQTAPEGTPRSRQGAPGPPQGDCKYTPRHPKGHQRAAKGSPTSPRSPDACYLRWFQRVP